MAGPAVTASDKEKMFLAEFLTQQPCLRTQCRITAAESMGRVSDREERIEPTLVSTKVGKEMDAA